MELMVALKASIEERKRQAEPRPSADFLAGYEKAREDLRAYGALKRPESVSR